MPRPKHRWVDLPPGTQSAHYRVDCVCGFSDRKEGMRNVGLRQGDHDRAHERGLFPGQPSYTVTPIVRELVR